jgi:hypothetical protein
MVFKYENFPNTYSVSMVSKNFRNIVFQYEFGMNEKYDARPKPYQDLNPKP